MGNSFRQTVAGIFSNPKMSSTHMLEGHLYNTLGRVESSSSKYLIAAQDTTYYNYSGHKQMKGLGVIQGNTLGIMQHNVLLMNEMGEPLGILDQQYWTREGGKDFEGKESLKWFRGLEATNKHLGVIDKKVVNVSDREADIFAFFKADRAENVSLLVRVHQPRNMEVSGGQKPVKLDTISSVLPTFGSKEVLIQRKNRAVRLTLALRGGLVNVYPDKALSAKKHKTQGLYLVIAEETACVDNLTAENLFNGQERAIWYLLTSLPVENQTDVERVVDFYAFRWRIERFHYLMKSGALQVEKLQFETLHSTINALSFYSVVAWQILAMTYFIRQAAEYPANRLFEEDEIAVLQSFSTRKIDTVKDMVLALGKIMGFAPSKKQPFPGAKVLAQALERLHFMKLGFFASRLKPLQD